MTQNIVPVPSNLITSSANSAVEITVGRIKLNDSSDYGAFTPRLACCGTAYTLQRGTFTHRTSSPLLGAPYKVKIDNRLPKEVDCLQSE